MSLQIYPTVSVIQRNQARYEATVSGITISATAYTGGDQVGTLISFSSAARVTGGTGLITGCVLTDMSDIIGSYDVHFFRDTVTLAADNAAYAISDADNEKSVALLQFGGAFDVGNNRIAQAYNLAIPYDCVGTTLYAALIARVGHTFFSAGGANSLKLQIHVERN